VPAVQSTYVRLVIGAIVLGAGLSLIARAMFLIIGPVIHAPAVAAVFFLVAQPILWTAVDLLDRASHPPKEPPLRNSHPIDVGARRKAA
jgi:hypothetical protein